MQHATEGALSRFAERGAGWRKPPPTSALDFSLRTKNAAQRTVRGVPRSTSRVQRLPDRAVSVSPDFVEPTLHTL